jgi:hypothetical protein
MASIRAFGAGWASDSAGDGHAFVGGLSLVKNKGERGMGILGVSPWLRVKGVACRRGGGNLVHAVYRAVRRRRGGRKGGKHGARQALLLDVGRSPSGCAAWAASIRGFGAGRSSDSEGDGPTDLAATISQDKVIRFQQKHQLVSNPEEIHAALGGGTASYIQLRVRLRSASEFSATGDGACAINAASQGVDAVRGDQRPPD